MLPITPAQALSQNSAAPPEESDSSAKTPDLEEILIRPSLGATAQSVTVITLSESLNVRLDDSLRQEPGVTLFRRANSLSAHPTTQGLTMRGVGANGAGRVLVTLDGVPLNDPFGGWINWSAINIDDYATASIFKGGGSGAFGSQALAGTIELTEKQNASNTLAVRAEYGELNSLLLSGSGTIKAGNHALSLSYKHFDSDGFFLFSEDQRGPIDVPAASSVDAIRAAAKFNFDNITLQPVLRLFEENRINGLSAAPNQTRGLDASLRLNADVRGIQGELITYASLRALENTFASARDERTTERPVLDQLSVPGNAYGFLARLIGSQFELGVDGRFMDGSTQEQFRNLGAGFTREREAGGKQSIIGLYGETEFEGANWAINATSRLDFWRSFDGRRREINIADTSLLRQDLIADRSGSLLTGRIGGEYRVSTDVSLKAAGYRSWRLPTLNEFYRPFRVVNDITEANPDLVPEKLWGAEIGIAYRQGASKGFAADITLFQHWLQDGVGNITIGEGPGFFPLGGFVPPGGVLRQRAPIDEISTTGLEAQFDYRTNNYGFFANYLFADAEITAFAENPNLKGRRPVQTPEHSFTIGGYARFEGFEVRGDVRYQSGLFDDDLNTRVLPAIATLNLAISYAIPDTPFTLYARGENLLDADIIAALSSTGLETLAAPRLLRFGISARFN